MTEEMIQEWPRWKRWGLYAVAALSFTGILPLGLCGLLFEFFDATSWWLEIPVLAGGLYVIWRLAVRTMEEEVESRGLR